VTTIRAYLLKCGSNEGKFKQSDSFEMAVDKVQIKTLRTGSFKLFKRPFPGFLTILTL